jgi:hypothetical protein
MVLDSAEAPYVRTGYRYTPGAAAPKEMAAEKQAPSVPQPPDCETQLKELEQKYRQLELDLDKCLKQRSLLQQQMDGGARPLAPSPTGSRPGPPRPEPDTNAQRQPYLTRPVVYLGDQRPIGPPHHEGIIREPAVGMQSVIREPQEIILSAGPLRARTP